jgi:hypothetical protein
MTKEEQFKATLNKMGKVFTTRDFAKAGKRFGITQDDVSYGRVFLFLIESCTRVNRQTWERRDEQRQILFDVEAPNTASQLTEQSAIQLLKSLGYKIMRVTEVEI